KIASAVRPTDARCRTTAVTLILLLSTLAVALASPTARAASPVLTILSPADRSIVDNGTPVIVRFLVSNFTLVQPGRFGQGSAPNEGHVQLLVLDSVVMELIPHGSVLLVALPDGDITITARLVNNDGSPLNPDASATVPIHVTASSAVSLPLVINGGMALLLAF